MPPALSPQAASNHLAKLLEGDLVAVETEGRHRYYRLAGPTVATALEALACVAPRVRDLDTPRSREARRLRDARSCYDHLAGRLSIALAQALEGRRLLLPTIGDGGKRYLISNAGKAWFAELGIDADQIKPGKHGIARRCLDWTERRHHLAGPLGARLLERMTELEWLQRGAGRQLTLTEAGRLALQDRLGLAFEPGRISDAA